MPFNRLHFWIQVPLYLIRLASPLCFSVDSNWINCITNEKIIFTYFWPFLHRFNGTCYWAGRKRTRFNYFVRVSAMSIPKWIGLLNITRILTLSWNIRTYFAALFLFLLSFFRFSKWGQKLNCNSSTLIGKIYIIFTWKWWYSDSNLRCWLWHKIK